MTFKELHCLLPNKKASLLFFEVNVGSLFIKWALPLLENGYSIGIGTNMQLENTSRPYSKSPWEGIFFLHFTHSETTILCFSSGTTNAQKGIVRNFKSWKKSFHLISELMKNQHSHTGIVLGPLPFSLSLFGAMESLFRGKAPLILKPKQFLKGLIGQESKTYLLWATPLHCSFFIRAFIGGYMAPQYSIKFIFVVGAYFSNQQRDQLQLVFPKAKIYSFYGTSETSFICLKSPSDQSESVGTICKGVKVSIRNSKNKCLPINAKGGIWVSGPYLFKQYINKYMKNNTLNNYFLTNDIGFIDSKNRLFFKGRKHKKQSISGHSINVYELELWYKHILNQERLALFIVPDELKENKIVLVLAEQLSPAQWINLKAKAIKTLGPQGIPTKWSFCPSWPQTENGKLNRRALKKFL